MNDDARRDLDTGGKEKPIDANRPFVSQVLTFYGIGIALVVGILFLWFASNVLLVVFAGVLIAILLNRSARRLGHWLHLRYAFSLFLVILVTALLLAALAYFLAPRIAEQGAQILQAIPDALRRLQSYLAKAGWAKGIFGSMPPVEEMLKDASSMLGRAVVVFSGLFGALGTFVIILFVGIYLAVQPGVYIHGLLKLVPINKRPRAQQVVDEIGDTLSYWLFGKLCSMLVVGIATGIGLHLIGLPLAFTLGIITGLFDFIPYIGPLLAGVPAVLIAFSQGPTMALYVILLMVGIQLVESYLMMPLIERRTVSIPPALSISVQVLMGIPFGLMGMALATPLTAVLCVLVAMLYVHDLLGDKVSLPSEQ